MHTLPANLGKQAIINNTLELSSPMVFQCIRHFAMSSLRSRHHYHPHFTNVDAGSERTGNLSDVTQLLSVEIGVVLNSRILL